MASLVHWGFSWPLPSEFSRFSIQMGKIEKKRTSGTWKTTGYMWAETDFGRFGRFFRHLEQPKHSQQAVQHVFQQVRRQQNEEDTVERDSCQTRLTRCTESDLDENQHRRQRR
jgi:hypothetical protein